MTGVRGETSGRGRASHLVELPADIEAFTRECAERGWSDGLPVIPPTEDRVAAMLACTDRDPLAVIGVLSPRQGEATVHALAVNAVMAGCEPRWFPILVAAFEAIAEPEFNIASINSTTHPCGVFVLVNGPIAREAGVHAGAGCFGPTFPANATIGRAVRLALLNVAGATPGAGDRSTQGSPAKFAFCAGEREAVNPWGAYHVSRGFEPSTSTVTVFGAEGPHNIQEHGSDSAEGILRTIAGSMGQAGSNHIFRAGQPVLVLGPEHAETIAADGLTREDIQRYLFEHARFPAASLDPWFRLEYRVRLPAGEEHRADAADLRYPVADRPEHFHVLVAGGAGKHSSWLPTFGNQTVPQTRIIALADGTAAASLEDFRR